MPMGYKKIVFSNEMLGDIEKLYRKGIKPPTIARKYKCSAPTIRKQLRERGVIQ